MTSRARKPENVAKGTCRTSGGLIKTVCAFDEDTHEYIRNRAIKYNTSFAEQVRLLVEFGIIDVELEDGYKPKRLHSSVVL